LVAQGHLSDPPLGRSGLVLIIGVSGSILVFESEIEHAVYSHLWRSSGVTHTAGAENATFPAVINTLKREYPGYQITAAYMPDKAGDNFEVFAHKNEQFRYVFLNEKTGQVVGDIVGWKNRFDPEWNRRGMPSALMLHRSHCLVERLEALDPWAEGECS
jgi:uncharacterized iron-regulated membrane protein